MALNTRESLIQGMATVGVPAPAEDVILHLLAKVERNKPKRPVGYAFIVGRNWAISALRAIQSRANLEVLATHKAARAQAEAAKLERFRRAEAEFVELALKGAIRGAAPEVSAAALLATVFHGADGTLLAVHLGIKRDALHQRICRAKKQVIAAGASEDLRWAFEQQRLRNK